jgi:hypothetical protein
MRHLFIWLVWALVIAGLCVAGDQFLLRAAVNSPVYTTAQTFYKDFRGRIIRFVQRKDQRLEEIKENRPPTPLPAVKERILMPPEEEPSGYVYSDKAGGLHLTTHLDEVPKEYRAAAKPLKK